MYHKMSSQHVYLNPEDDRVKDIPSKSFVEITDELKYGISSDPSSKLKIIPYPKRFFSYVFLFSEDDD